MSKHIVRTPAGTKLGRQLASANSTGTKPDRNKYNPIPRGNPVDRAKWNAQVEREKHKSTSWRWEMNAAGDSMQIVSPTGRIFPLWWGEDGGGKHVVTRGIASYPPALAYVRGAGERAETIVNRIVLFLNTGEIT